MKGHSNLNVMTRLEADFLVLLIYAAAAFLIFRYVKRKKHPARSVWESFGLVAGAVTCAVFCPIMLTLALDALIDLPRNSSIAFGLTGGIAILLIRTWRWSIARIGHPPRAATDVIH